MAVFIETASVLEMVRVYGLRPRLWLMLCVGSRCCVFVVDFFTVDTASDLDRLLASQVIKLKDGEVMCCDLPLSRLSARVLPVHLL